MKRKSIQLMLGGVIALTLVFFQNFYKDYSSENSNIDLLKIIKDKASGSIIIVEAKVIKQLKDDLKGSKHQKFIIKTNQISLLVAHNIDKAPRVPLKYGDDIIIKGEYEWNEQGGLIHWTHISNNNKHPHGWIKHKNKIYQ